MGGGPMDLGALGGDFSIANGINDSAQVTGYGYLTGNATRRAVRWSGGLPLDLGTLGGGSSEGYAINGAGDVVGLSYLTGDSVQHAFLSPTARCTT